MSFTAARGGAGTVAAPPDRPCPLRGKAAIRPSRSCHSRGFGGSTWRKAASSRAHAEKCEAVFAMGSRLEALRVVDRDHFRGIPFVAKDAGQVARLTPPPSPNAAPKEISAMASRSANPLPWSARRVLERVIIFMRVMDACCFQPEVNQLGAQFPLRIDP